MTNLNDHLQRQISSQVCEMLPPEVRDDVLADYQIMSHLGIDNDEDQNRFFLVRNHVPEIIHLVFNGKLNDKTAARVAAEVFRNRENAPIGTLLELIEATDLALKKMVPEELRPKIAYPQPGPRQQLPQYDIGRWVDVTRQIYGLMAKGQSREHAKQAVMGNWDRREQMDYENWLKFYTEKVPEKYPKLAQDQSDLNIAGIPITPNILRAVMPTPPGQGHAQKQPPGEPQNLPHKYNDVDDVRDRIETQRRKLVSRLNSAEKLLSGMDGQLFAGDDQELMLKLLQDLKRKIQTANKRTANSTLFEDYIYRTANLLKVRGKDEAAGFFYKIAQLPPLPPPPGGGLGGPPGGGLGGPPGEEGGPEGGSPEGDKQATHDLLKEFFDGLKRGVSDKDDEKKEREKAEKKDKPEDAEATPPPAPAPEAGGEGGAPPPPPPPPPGGEEGGEEEPPAAEAAITVDDMIKIGKGFWHPELVSLAQAAPMPGGPPGPRVGPAPGPRAPVPSAAPAPAPSQAPIADAPDAPGPEVVADEGEDKPGVATDNTDDVIEAALKNVSVNDVITRLEMLVSIYNQREISRQLAILDIMMDRIGLASFFPQLGEAMSKALEANQYIGNRLQEVLGKVKGSVDAPGAQDWIEVTPDDHPETEGIRNRLENQKNKEERRKELRKEKEMARMEGSEPEAIPEAPVVGDAAELQQPSRVEKAPKLDVR